MILSLATPFVLFYTSSIKKKVLIANDYRWSMYMANKVYLKIMRNAAYLAVLFHVLTAPACTPVAETTRSTSSQPLTIQKYNKIIREGKPAFTLSEAEAALSETSLLVEKYTGKKFEKLPPVKLINRNELAEILLEELKPQYTKEFPNYTKEQIHLISLIHSKTKSISFLGKYQENDGTLYLMPTNLNPMLQLARIDKKHTQPILRLLVAHELTHALQDQETQLKRFDQIDKFDEKLAFAATIEGHAVFVQNKIAEELGLQDSMSELLRFLSSESVTFREPLLEVTKNINSIQDEQKYIEGEKFIRYHHELGGNERVWEILAHPPAKTSMIIHPESYNSAKLAEIDYASLFENFEQVFGEGDWVSQNTEIGEMSLYSFLANLNESDREEMISQISNAQYFSSINQKQDKKLSILVMIFKDDLFSSKGVDLLVQRIQKRVRDLKSSSLISVKDFLMEDFSGIQADKAVKMSFSVSGNILVRKTKEVIVYIGKGNIIIELNPIDMEINNESIMNMVKMILDKYELLK
jgi:hypothetical protein